MCVFMFGIERDMMGERGRKSERVEGRKRDEKETSRFSILLLQIERVLTKSIQL